MLETVIPRSFAMRPRSTVATWALLVVAIAGLSALAIAVIHYGDWLQTRLPEYWFISGVFTIGGLAGWSIAVTRPSWVPPLVSAAAVLLVAASLLASLASARPGLSLPATWDLVTKSGTALGFCAVARWPSGRRILVGAAAVVLVAVMGSYLVIVGHQWLSWVGSGLPWRSVPLRPAVTGGLAPIPPVMGDIVLLLAPLVAVAAVHVHRYGRAIAALVVLAATACVIISGTRTLWLMAAVVLGLLGFRWVQSRGGAKMVGAVAAVAVMGLLAAFAIGLPDRVARDLDEGRISAFSTAFAMAARSPVLGTGPATYPAERLSDMIPVFAHYAFPNAHDIVLSTLGETGLVGLAALLGATLLIGGQLRRTWRASSTSRLFVAATMAGTAIVIAHAMVDVVIEYDGVLLICFIVGAVGLIPSPEHVVDWAPPRVGRLDNPLVPRVAGFIAFAVLIAVGPRTLAVQQSMIARIAAQDSAKTDPIGALNLAQRAVDLQPDSAAAVDQLMVLADSNGDSQTAIAAARRLVALEGLAQHRIELAIVLDRVGQHEAALSEARMALARDTVDPFVQLNGAVLLAAAGDTAGATAALARLVVAQPLIGLQAAALPTAVGRLMPAATSSAITMLQAAGRSSDALAAALTGDSTLAAAVLDGAPAEQRPPLTQLRNAWLGDDAALSALEASLRADPVDPTMVKWAWLLETRRCATAAASRWARVLRILDGEPVGVPVQLGAGLSRWSMRPPYYPGVLYPLGAPAVPYVMGTWTYTVGPPVCASK